MAAEDATLPAPVVWVSEENFNDFPTYEDKKNLGALPEWIECRYPSCEAVNIEGSNFLYSILITSKNFKDLLIGTWTGGDCSNDYWTLTENGDFESAIPEDDETYSWSGTYTLNDTTYIEKGINNRNKPEHNEAWLYFVPAMDAIIFKGTRSFDSNSKKFIDYEDDSYIYLKRCNPPNKNSQ